MGFSGQVHRSDLPFPPPVDHVLSELSTMTRPSSMALHGMAHSFTELCKPLRHDKTVIHEGVTEAEEIKKREQEYTEELYKKDLNDSDNHEAVVTHAETDILQYEVK